MGWMCHRRVSDGPSSNFLFPLYIHTSPPYPLSQSVLLQKLLVLLEPISEQDNELYRYSPEYPMSQAAIAWHGKIRKMCLFRRGRQEEAVVGERIKGREDVRKALVIEMHCMVQPPMQPWGMLSSWSSYKTVPTSTHTHTLTELPSRDRVRRETTKERIWKRMGRKREERAIICSLTSPTQYSQD